MPVEKNTTSVVGKKYRYTFGTCREDAGAELEDGRLTIFRGACGENAEEIPEGMVYSLKYVKAGLRESVEDFADDFVEKLQNANIWFIVKKR